VAGDGRHPGVILPDLNVQPLASVELPFEFHIALPKLQALLFQFVAQVFLLRNFISNCFVQSGITIQHRGSIHNWRSA
jgi:hypothetical protein